MTTMTVAAVQAEAQPGQVANNALLAAKLVREAAGREAQIVVLPELFLPSYHLPALYANPQGTTLQADDEGVITDPRLDPLRENGTITLVGASVSYPDGRRTCAIVLVDRAGKTVAVYDKQHLSGPDEKALFTPGTRGATLTVEGWRFGLGICYDGCFPEHGRAAAVNDDVHGYLIPAAYLEGSKHRRDVYYAARALDNTMYVVFANVIGGESPWSFVGGAAIYDPQGRCLAKGDDETEAVIVATLDKEEITATRAKQSMLQDLLPNQGGPRRQIKL